MERLEARDDKKTTYRQNATSNELMNDGHEFVVGFYDGIVTIVLSLGKSFNCIGQNVQNFVHMRTLTRTSYLLTAIIHFPETFAKSMIGTRKH